jgi:phosphoribosylformimino-5-aminoimidazole carboxamide ribotide isomerase
MKLFPAIDIKNGQCVRLRQGQFHNVEVYSQVPVRIAKNFQESGAAFIHIVDLDGALAGHSVNEDVIKAIVENVSIPVEVGGGIRTIQDIETKLNLGVGRVIIGTSAVENPHFVREALRRFGNSKIVVGIDAKNGMVATDGWEKISNYNAVQLALEMKEIGIKTIIYTDISRDGMLSGPNLEHTRDMVEKTQMDIIASGGVSSMKDLDDLNSIPVYGAIIGKALYENRVNLREAVKKYGV